MSTGKLIQLNAVILAVMVLWSCGSERSSSGVWRDTSCTDEDPSTVCPRHVFELHLGRYGQTVTGILVKFRAEDGLDPYQRTNVCGCYFIESGRANAEALEFRIFSPSNTCSDSSNGMEEACDACDCQAPRFKLVSEDDEVLTGSFRCPGQPESPSEFIRSSGRVRTTCKDLVQAP
ncbi:MAG: hypothetical protein VX589_19855 [Myxococcota bacterium]|nr:hypothetical protein [Myxococcota bacterium]